MPFWPLDPESGSGINNPDHISECLEPFFGLKYLNSLMRIRDLGWKKFGSGMEKYGSGIRDKHPRSATLPKWYLLDSCRRHWWRPSPPAAWSRKGAAQSPPQSPGCSPAARSSTCKNWIANKFSKKDLKVVGNGKEGRSERCQTFTICLWPRRSMFFSLLILLSFLILWISVSAPVNQNE